MYKKTTINRARDSDHDFDYIAGLVQTRGAQGGSNLAKVKNSKSKIQILAFP